MNEFEFWGAFRLSCDTSSHAFSLLSYVIFCGSFRSYSVVQNSLWKIEYGFSQRLDSVE